MKPVAHTPAHMPEIASALQYGGGTIQQHHTTPSHTIKISQLSLALWAVTTYRLSQTKIWIPFSGPESPPPRGHPLQRDGTSEDQYNIIPYQYPYNHQHKRRSPIAKKNAILQMTCMCAFFVIFLTSPSKSSCFLFKGAVWCRRVADGSVKKN